MVIKFYNIPNLYDSGHNLEDKIVKYCISMYKALIGNCKIIIHIVSFKISLKVVSPTVCGVCVCVCVSVCECVCLVMPAVCVVTD